MGNIGYGLCCVCLSLKDEVSYKKMTAARFRSLPSDKARERLGEICLNNAEALYKIVDFCRSSRIAHYRIPSDIFPLVSFAKLDIEFENLPFADKIFALLAKAGKAAKSADIGVSFHPSQFVVLASSDAKTRKSAAAEINFNAEIFDIMGVSKNVSAPINIHMNTSPQRENFAADFDDGLARLTKSARRRLAFENEDRGFWTAAKLVDFLKPYKIPTTFDFLHHKLNNGGESERDMFFKCAATWSPHTPIFHYAESASEKNPRAHSDFCKSSPPDFGIPYICQIEAKAKDFAIAELLTH